MLIMTIYCVFGSEQGDPSPALQVKLTAAQAGKSCILLGQDFLVCFFRTT